MSQSNYTTLKDYYRNQNNNIPQIEHYSEYNVGKFEIMRDKFNQYKIINIDKTIFLPDATNKMPDFVADGAKNSGGVLTFNANQLPDNFELKSVRVFMKYGDKWAQNIIPFINQYISFDSKTKTITIGKPGYGLQSQVLYVQDKLASPIGDPFARVYMTW